jgi:aldose 1-epimerase
VTRFKIDEQHFGELPDGRAVTLYTLVSDNGMEVSVINYGGAITSIKVPDRNGKLGDVVLGYDTLREYVENPRYLGALIGRHANRLAQGRFSLNGTEYQLAQNNGPNHLHGGPNGFDKVFWEGRTETCDSKAVLHLTYLSKAGDERYPGNLKVNVDYVLTRANEFRIEYRATTDKDTIVNLTNHSYFNLGSNGGILDHELLINAESFTPVSGDLIPLGEIRPVRGTPMDFTVSHAIGARIKEPYDQLGFTGGYDHNFVLRGENGSLRLAARVYEPLTGRRLEVFTTAPGLQFYSGNFLDGTIAGKSGFKYQKYTGFCLETQHFPDAPHHPNFPTTVLRPGEEYKHDAVFRFSTGSAGGPPA